jgi:hypothetical protein
MRKIKEVLRLKWAKGLSNPKIATSSGIGREHVLRHPEVKKRLALIEAIVGLVCARNRPVSRVWPAAYYWGSNSL